MIGQILFLVVGWACCSAEVWMSPNALTSAEKEEILRVHNDYRASIGASNMLKLRWDPKLADLAQGHADHCADYHTNLVLPDGTRVGQNLAMSSSSRYKAASGVNGWIGEEKFYNFDTLECQGGWKPCGHLTQVITARTEWIGCALKRDCPGTWKSLLVCNYFPGNDIRTTFAHGAPCSACPGAKCENGLCACDNPNCGRHGRLNVKTCKCACEDMYSGAACDRLTCPPKDKPYCGSVFPPEFCKKYSNVPGTCPYMCGVC